MLFHLRIPPSGGIAESRYDKGGAARNDKGGGARNDSDEVALEMAVSLSFHLRMPPSGGIAESRYDIDDFLDNLRNKRFKNAWLLDY